MIEGEMTIGRDLKTAFKKLHEKARAKILKKAVAASKVHFLEALKDYCPEFTGALKESLGEKQKVYRGGDVHVAIIGARMDREFDAQVTFKDAQGNTVTKTVKKIPWVYLAEIDADTGFIRAAFEAAKEGAAATSLAVLKAETQAALSEEAR